MTSKLGGRGQPFALVSGKVLGTLASLTLARGSKSACGWGFTVSEFSCWLLMLLAPNLWNFSLTPRGQGIEHMGELGAKCVVMELTCPGERLYHLLREVNERQ